MRVRADVTGDLEVLKELKALPGGVDRIKDVLWAAATRIAGRAKLLCPVDPIDGGELRDSIRAPKPREAKSTGRITSSILAGGAMLANLVSERGHKDPGIYAEVIHEDSTLHHSQGQHKFIEQPWLEEAPKVPDAMLTELEKAKG